MKICSIVIALLLVITGEAIANQDFQGNLYDFLFSNYTKSFLPHHDQPHYVNVSLDLQLLQKLNLFQGTMHMNVWRALVYKDERLTWDPTAFGNIRRFNVYSSVVWVPDISIWNSASNEPSIDYSEAIIYPDGTIALVVPMFVDASCGLDLSDFPYDTHNCSLTFGSWTNDNSRIVLDTTSNSVGLSHFSDNPMWHIVETSVQKNSVVSDCCEEVYEDVTFYITISRRESHGRIGPAVVSVWLILAVFLMQPSKGGERIIFAGLVFVSLIVLNAALSAEVPAYSVTRLGRFLLAGMLINSIVVVINAIIYRFYPAEQQGTTKAQSSFSAPRVFFLLDVAVALILFVVLTILTGALFS
ncbi:neuronal acetylcholine receptor subunit alpha-2 isoform X1 [Strongylocentrotus purpuratus]|uniref:Neurotransmitter-gated ion-channel ligand-binding domain-containing protein n=2 Tax=Strongylocentrotus purpuratus TaxID=7668 RepID=A0A7M7SXD9_STRPU|nr:neuronal acetylcholine receptor subunit alpha-2 isoform X1 [Strongylocentrotus purpuratus]|eukprot:XP_011665546.1 PREDICTED: neuronal acetylcholine receptor subunit alpha-2 isoform X1 [Strongylocentrotus purpuratus]